MTKYVHDNHRHVYYLTEGIYGSTLKQYNKDEGAPATSIDLDSAGVANFKKMLKDGGWYEQSTPSKNP